MKTQKIALTKLIPDPQNANTHGEQNLSVIRKNIEKFGMYAPLVVQKSTMNIIVGNGRYECLKAMGEEKVDCVVLDITDAKAIELGIADNRSSELSEWDEDVLADLLGAIGGDAVEEIGFSADDLADLFPDGGNDGETDPDDIPPAPREARTEVGDRYVLGDHVLVCGDCADTAVVTGLFGDILADMVFTDPPYGVSYVGKTSEALTIQSDSMTPEELAKNNKLWFDNVDRVCRPGAYILATVPAGPLHLIFAQDWLDRGWLRQIMVWNKDSMVLGHSEYHYKHEPILFGWKEGGTRLKNTDRTKTTVWDFDRPKASREHPTMKPVEMWVYGIKQHTKKGNIVFEPFGGSGTTLLACEKTGRRCYTTEIDPIYCDVIVQRYCDFVGIDAEHVFESKTTD